MSKKVFFCRVSEGGLIPSSSLEKEWARVALTVRPETRLKVTVEEVEERNMEILQQRRYYRGVIVKILAWYMGYTTDEMHYLLKQNFLSYTKKGKVVKSKHSSGAQRMGVWIRRSSLCTSTSALRSD